MDQAMIVTLSKEIFITNLFTYSNNDVISNYDIDGCFTLKSIYRSIKNIITVRWNGVSIKLSKTVSIVFGVLALIYRVFSILSDIRSIKKLLNKKLATAIVAALPYGTAMISAEIISWVCNVGVAVAALSAILSFFTACCTGGIFNIAKTALQFVVSYVAPTIIAAVQMLYYGHKKNRGSTNTVKFFGGSSVSF